MLSRWRGISHPWIPREGSAASGPKLRSCLSRKDRELSLAEVSSLPQPALIGTGYPLRTWLRSPPAPCQPPRVSSRLAGTAAPAWGQPGHSAFPHGEMGMALEAALPGVLCPGSCSRPAGAGAQGSPWLCKAPAAPWGFPAPGLPEESCWHCRGSCWPRHSGKSGLS